MFTKTTDSILKVFTKTIAELEAHIKVQDVAAEKSKIAADELIRKRMELLDDAAKAQNAVNKLKAIFD